MVLCHPLLAQQLHNDFSPTFDTGDSRHPTRHARYSHTTKGFLSLHESTTSTPLRTPERCPMRLSDNRAPRSRKTHLPIFDYLVKYACLPGVFAPWHRCRAMQTPNSHHRSNFTMP